MFVYVFTTCVYKWYICLYFLSLISNKFLSMSYLYIDEGHENKYEDYNGTDNYYITGRSISDAMKIKYNETINVLWPKIENQLYYMASNSWDSSVYTGSSGIGLMLMLLANRTKNKDYLIWPHEWFPKMIKKLKGRKETFLTGRSGALAVTAVMFKDINPEVTNKSLEMMLHKMCEKVMEKHGMYPDSLMYGRAGYLYALLFVHKYLNNNEFIIKKIRKVVEILLLSGRALSKYNYDVLRRKNAKICPLMYEYKKKNYLGAPHGVAGILYTLLQAKEFLLPNDLNTTIRPTIDYLMRSQFYCGNFQQIYRNETDRLVQWCHGCPGFVHLFSKAYQLFGDKKYLDSALKCGEVVWQRGILLKGYSICHGAAGNGYVFLELYQLTKDVKHLHRAACFGDWCTTWPNNQQVEPCNTFSLFEGIGGIIYYLTDLQTPELASFPAFTV